MTRQKYMKPAASLGGREARQSLKNPKPYHHAPRHCPSTHSLAPHVLTTPPDSTRERKRLLAVAVVDALTRNHATRLTTQALLKSFIRP